MSLFMPHFFSPLVPLLMGEDLWWGRIQTSCQPGHLLASHFLGSMQELEHEFVFQEPAAA